MAVDVETRELRRPGARSQVIYLRFRFHQRTNTLGQRLVAPRLSETTGNPWLPTGTREQALTRSPFSTAHLSPSISWTLRQAAAS